MDDKDDFFDMLAKSPVDGAPATNSSGGGSGSADDGGEVDFFELLNISNSRLDDQRSSYVPKADKAMVLNLDLLRNQMAGESLVTNNLKEFPCLYIGHEQCHLQKDKEALCNDIVSRKCAMTNASIKGRKDALSSVVKCTAEGIEFVLGSGGAASVRIPLEQVACVSLCSKKPGGQLKIVAVLCRSPLAREGKRGVGELGMVCHVCRLRDGKAMWEFQNAFVVALKERFPQHHKEVDPKAQYEKQQQKQREEEQKKRQAELARKNSDLKSPSIGTASPMAEKEQSADPYLLSASRSQGANSDVSRLTGVPSQITAPSRPFVHKIYVKSQDQVSAEDKRFAEALQRSEEASFRNHQKHEIEDAAMARMLQSEEDASLAQRMSVDTSIRFDDVGDDLP
eukprot:m.660632 g.660632  ORF g.660632 m.660632 type:complete len:396 (-) comp22731_c0_seq7:2229-3416(-)